MPRTYKTKAGSRSYKNYSDENVEEAVQNIANGHLSIKKAAQQYKIPYGTLYNRFHGKHIHKPGGQTVLSEVEEMCIVGAVQKCGDWGFPLSTMDVQMFTKSYLDKKGITVTKFKNNVPGLDWIRGFVKRHGNQLSQRISPNISQARANLSREAVKDYFENLTNTVENVPFTHIFNYDESNLTDDPGKKLLLYRRGVKYPEKIMNHSKSSTTIMICGSASGTLLPPYVVYRSEHLWDTWTQGGPKGSPCCCEPCCSRGTRYNRTNHGWMEAQCFSDWFHSVFLPHARRLRGRKVLIGDNLASHFTDEVLSTCAEENVAFVCLPPNSTHICQPLDVSFFRLMKTAWRSNLTSWKMRNPRQHAVPRSVFPSLLTSTLEKMDTVKDFQNGGGAVRRNLISGFEATGIVLVNADKVLNRLPGNSEDPAEVNVIINDSLTEFLREHRYGHADKGICRRRKKVNVVPGKSISGPSEITSESDNEDMVVDMCSTDSSDVDESEESLCYSTPTLEALTVGKFVLVKVISGKRKSVTFRYVAVIQECTENEYSVMGLKSTDKDKIRFKSVENDTFVVHFNDILAVLPDPEIDQSGDRVKYVFQSKVDVNEN